MDGADFGGDELEGSAGADGLELSVVTDEANEGASVAGVGGDRGEVARGGHTGFVDEDDVAGVDGACSGVGVMEPFRDGC